MGFVKLDTGILDSTLWLSDAEVRIVFITMLAMANPDGMCEATAPGIARRANLSIEAVREAIKILEAPDEDSRSLEDEGRRIRRVDGGYQITNFLKYREKDHTAAVRKRRERERKRAADSDDVTRDNCDVTRDVTEPSASASAYESAYESSSESEDAKRKSGDDRSKQRQTAERFEEWWSIYPKKRNRQKACKIWKSKKLDAKADELIADVRRRLQFDRQWLDGYAPHPPTYLNNDRWEDEIEKPAGKLNGATKREGCLDDASPV